MKTRILVVEDEAFIRLLVAETLTSQGFEVQVASSAVEARGVIADFEPAVAVLDIELGQGPTGLDLANALRQTKPDIAFVFLTNLPEPRFLGRGDSKIPEGSAYLRKSNLRDPEVLTKAIAAVIGKTDSQKFRDDVRSSHPLSRISKSQLEILRLVALGRSNQEIAAIRGTTLRAVEGLLKRTIASAGIEISDMAHGRVLAAREFMKAAGLPEQH
ncbi:MAG: hypothetical protein RIS55_689 [Actinomycetota bacterium]|jgi:DNA-binding NarL/FixJ family response regulator